MITVKGSGVGSIVIANSEYCISRQLMAIRVKEQWNSVYLFFALLQDASLIGAAATGLIPGIARSDLLDKCMIIPPLPEQAAIAEVLTEMDAELAGLEQRREKTLLVKQGMIQELLTGRTRLV